MKISQGITYQAAGDKVFVRNGNTQTDYLLAGTAQVVLDYVATNPNCSVTKLIDFICARYENAAAKEIQRELYEFLDELLGEKILTEVDEPASPSPNLFAADGRHFAITCVFVEKKPRRVKRYCMASSRDGLRHC